MKLRVKGLFFSKGSYASDFHFGLAGLCFMPLSWLRNPLLRLGGSFCEVSSSPLARTALFHGKLFLVELKSGCLQGKALETQSGGDQKLKRPPLMAKKRKSISFQPACQLKP